MGGPPARNPPTYGRRYFLGDRTFKPAPEPTPGSRRTGLPLRTSGSSCSARSNRVKPNSNAHPSAPGSGGEQPRGQLSPVLLRGRVPRRRRVRTLRGLGGHHRSDTALDPIHRPRSHRSGRWYAFRLRRAGRGEPDRRGPTNSPEPNGTSPALHSPGSIPALGNPDGRRPRTGGGS